MRISVSSASVPKPGETANGDAAVVRQEAGKTLFAVIDALGHGPHAETAATSAVRCLQAFRLDEGVEAAVWAMHSALVQSRGAAVLVGLAAEGQVSLASVGNIGLRSRRSAVSLVPENGVVGQRLSRVRSYVSRLLVGDRLIVFSDGISSRISADELLALGPEDACRGLLSAHSRGTDDATVMVLDVEET